MQYQSIKTNDAYESPTNPRGTKFTDAPFNDLVASIKEKGILVPVIARKNPRGGKTYEVVAGNRRLRAAIKAGLSEIPADVRPMTDDEAREVQVIENLQREDVHPLEEGEAYRHLIEESGYEIAAVAAKVGKSETYVRQRLLLTNLCPGAAKAYRAGDINDGHAVLIARLAPKDQSRALEYATDWNEPNVEQLRDWIKREFDQPLKHQPWLKDNAAAEAVGPCKECPPVRSSLFGDVREGQCTSIKCWERKMAAYIAYAKKQNSNLILVSTEYGEAPKGVIGRGRYHVIEGKKDGCEYAESALVAHGSGTGSMLRICGDGDCKKHFATRTSGEYARTPKEKAARKKEIARAKAKEIREYDAFVATIKSKVSWPLSEKCLDALLADAIESHGVTSLAPVARRLGFKLVKEKSSWGGLRNSYKPPLREWLKNASKEDRLRMFFELRLGRNSTAFKAL